MEQYKRILLKEFDSRQKVITELTNLEAILNLPKGTELYISDIHGEFAAFDYILRSCAGILNEKIKDCFGDSLSESHKDRLSALVSYLFEDYFELYKAFNSPSSWLLSMTLAVMRFDIARAEHYEIGRASCRERV